MQNFILFLIGLCFLTLASCATIREHNDHRPKLEDSTTFEEWDLINRDEHSSAVVVFQYRNNTLDSLHLIRVNGRVRFQVVAFRNQSYCVKYPGRPCEDAEPHLAKLLLSDESLNQLISQ